MILKVILIQRIIISKGNITTINYLYIYFNLLLKIFHLESFLHFIIYFSKVRYLHIGLFYNYYIFYTKCSYDQFGMEIFYNCKIIAGIILQSLTRAL